MPHVNCREIDGTLLISTWLYVIATKEPSRVSNQISQGKHSPQTGNAVQKIKNAVLSYDKQEL
jgi:hypothetical protein